MLLLMICLGMLFFLISYLIKLNIFEIFANKYMLICIIVFFPFIVTMMFIFLVEKEHGCLKMKLQHLWCVNFSLIIVYFIYLKWYVYILFEICRYILFKMFKF
jgi:hypothetical protein